MVLRLKIPIFTKWADNKVRQLTKKPKKAEILDFSIVHWLGKSYLNKKNSEVMPLSFFYKKYYYLANGFLVDT